MPDLDLEFLIRSVCFLKSFPKIEKSAKNGQSYISIKDEFEKDQILKA